MSVKTSLAPWIVLLSALVCFDARAQTVINAASCQEGDVQATLDRASADGDVVLIPAGTCTWTKPLAIAPSNSLTIQGAGAQSATAGGASTDGTNDYEGPGWTDDTIVAKVRALSQPGNASLILTLA